MAITYHQLDHAKKEIRLLKILPPEASSTASTAAPGPFDFSASPVRCELQYESLDNIQIRTSRRNDASNSILDFLLQDIPQNSTREYGRDPAAVMDLLRRNLGQQLRLDRDSSYDIGTERREALASLYPTFETILQEWLPSGLHVPPSSFESWLQTWIWTPLSNDEHHLETKSQGYFALSYVWMDHAEKELFKDGRYKGMEQMVRAAGSTSRELLEGDLSEDALDQFFGSKAEAAANTVEIEVDGKPVRVGKNLEKALRTLREVPEIQNGTRVWVDALCINQNDVAEKNVEVKRMGDIYKYAERVVSWLGDEKELSGETLEFMSKVGQSLNEEEATGPIVLNFFQQLHTDSALGMTRLLMRSYWKRIWVTQEIVMGDDKSTVLCGARRFLMSDILKCGKLLRGGLSGGLLNRYLRLNDETEEDYITLGDFQSGITKLMTLHDAKIDAKEADGNVPASNTLWFRIPSSCDATDPRDLVYGMLSLLPQKLTDLINVNYAKENNFVSVMTDFATAHIKSTKSLYWILHRPYAPFLKHADWPSWVPNLALPYSSAHWSWPAQNLADCPPARPEFSFKTDAASGKPLLVVKGFRLDVVYEASINVVMDRLDKARQLAQYLVACNDQEPSEETYSMIQDIQAQMVTLQASFIPDPIYENEEDENDVPAVTTDNAYKDTKGLKDALSECFTRLGLKYQSGHSIFDIPLDIGDEDDENFDLAEARAASLVNVPSASLIEQVREAFEEFELWGRSFTELFPASIADVEPGSFSFATVEDRTISLGRLFTTCKGYVGTTIGSVLPGDEVFILHGCPMPVLLRKSPVCDGAYSLQGGICVPGMDLNLPEGANEETISIC